MLGRPQESEAAAYCWKYIDRVEGDDPIVALERQLPEALTLLESVSEEQSTQRYSPGKWSMRQALSHTTDSERSFAYRALWFGRGFTTPLEGLPEDQAAAAAQADRVSWAAHVEEFQQVRLATISLFRNMPDEAWMRAGVVSGNVI
jgi:uncharacterized damage-inducible protein DinB